MNDKYTIFFEYIENVLPSMPNNIKSLFDELKEYFAQEEEEKPMFSEIGLQILQYMQSCDKVKIKTRDIAKGMNESCRKITGAMNKLVSDGFINKYKHRQNPCYYSLSEEGKNFNIDNYIKESL